jgi:N-acetylneuraminic acid mutarotase
VKLNLPHDAVCPSPRSGHTACIYENAMYIFGGKDDDNNKLNDLWKLDLNTYKWSEIKPVDG